jgi:hypothetical protein
MIDALPQAGHALRVLPQVVAHQMESASPQLTVGFPLDRKFDIRLIDRQVAERA